MYIKITRITDYCTIIVKTIYKTIFENYFWCVVCKNKDDLQFKSRDFLKFRNKITIKNPVENSNPAKANKKKDTLIIKSSFTAPTTLTYTYKTIQINSEYNNIAKIL